MEGITFLLILLLVGASGFCSSSETALFSLPHSKLRTYTHSKDGKKRLIAKLLQEPKQLLVTIFVLNTVVNILLQNSISNLSGQAGSWWYKVGIPFLVLLVFGEVLPKQIGLKHNAFLATLYAPVIYFFQHLIYPFVKIFVRFTSKLSRCLFFFLQRERSVTHEEIEHAISSSEEGGVILPEEAFLAKGYLEFVDANVKELMRHKEEVIAYDLHEPLSKLIHRMTDQECSRVPVYLESFDQLLGVIEIETFFHNKTKIQKPKDLLPFLKKPLYIPETAPAKVLLHLFDREKEEFALVIDEYGVVVGIITKEDLIETVIGSIYDLRDKVQYYTQVNATTIIAKGQMEIEEVEAFFGLDLASSDEVFSIGGWLTEQIGDIPQVGATFEKEGLFFKVLSRDPNRVKSVFIQKREQK